MSHMLRTVFCSLLLALLGMGTAVAAEKSTFIVLPFSVQGPQGFAYLERSIPQTLTSRLFWKDRVEPAAQGLAKGQTAPRDEAAAEQARVASGADYVVWGSVAIIGQDCTLDVRVGNKTGKTWNHTTEAKANQLMTAIRALSDTINREVFHREPEVAAAPAGATSGKGAGKVNQMNPDLMVNETTSKEVYLNPQFRYASSSTEDDARLRSQVLPFTSVGMEICDADGDGKNEIFILTDNRLYAYHFNSGKLTPLGEFTFPSTLDALTIRSLPTSGGRAQLIVSLIGKDGQPQSSILTFGGNKFTQEMKSIRHFLNVVKVPPDYLPTLVGQQAQPPKLFRSGVYEMVKAGGQLTQSRRIVLPPDANIWSFTFLPGGFDETGSDKIIVLSPEETLRTYNVKGSRLAQSEETFSGSSKGIEVSTSMSGLGEDDVTIKDMFYIPLRMLSVDFERDGKYELLVNRPISTASKIFNRYRFFPQSEIHSLFWDGLGLNLQWKTRRIKGSVADFAVADANNDGILDLVACINTHPGALGVEKRKTIVVVYPLDLTKTEAVPTGRTDD